MAALIKKETTLQPELVEGGRGEFTVWVGEEVAAQKSSLGFPSDEAILAAVRSRLTRS